MNKSAILSLFVLLFVLPSCKDDVVGGGVNIDIDDEFKVLLWETLGENERTFHLNLETIQSNSCENAVIEYSQFSQSSEIYLTVNAITNDQCALETYPAKADVPIGSLDQRDYDLEINLKNVVPNTGGLTVTDKYYEISMNDLNGIIIPRSRLYKVPENTIWGYVAFENVTGEEANDNFRTDLENLTTSASTAPGYYGYFEIEENYNIILSENTSNAFVKPFILNYNGSDDQLESLLAEHRTEFPNVNFKIYTSKGKEF